MSTNAESTGAAATRVAEARSRTPVSWRERRLAEQLLRTRRATQLWVFWVAPIVGALAAGWAARALRERTEPEIAGRR